MTIVRRNIEFKSTYCVPFNPDHNILWCVSFYTADGGGGGHLGAFRRLNNAF